MTRFVFSSAAIKALVALLLLAQLVFVFSYVGAERTVYYWDHAMYIGMASMLSGAFLDGFGHAFVAFKQSLGNDYNLIYSFPSLLGFALFGESRLVFIISNFLCFFVLQEIAVAWVLRKGLGLSWDRALLLGVGAIFLIPAAWVPLLQGYPDNSAAAALTFAFALTLDERREWRRALLLGLLLGGAVLLRRHYAYAVLSLLAVIGSFDLLYLYRQRSLAFFKKLSLFYALCGGALLGTLWVVAPEFLNRAVGTDYNSLYQSYHKSPGTFLLYAVDGLGFLLIATTVCGLALLIAKKKVVAQKIACLLTLWLVVWSFGPAQLGPHYLLQLLPLCAAVGIAGVFVFSASTARWIGPAKAALLIALVANSGYALWFAPEGRAPNWRGNPGVFSTPNPPVVRTDYDELVALASYLQQTTSADDRIIAIGSSFNFNQDILRAVYSDILHIGSFYLRFIQTPEIDGMQGPPFDPVATATVYVVPEPAQYHLDPEGQRVVMAAAKLFPPPPERAGLFVRDDKTFVLQNGVKVGVWRRKNPVWTPRELRAVIKDIRAVAGGALVQGIEIKRNWIITKQPLRAMVALSKTDSVQGLFGDSSRELALFYDQPLSSGNYKLSFSVFAPPQCYGMRFAADFKNEDGTKIKEDIFTPVHVPGTTSYSFVLPQNSEPVFLHLHIGVRPDLYPSGSCALFLHDLVVTRL
ncbi:MAG: hypothetical protein PHX43_05830 [Alphaproteobacteria bacterium]|nr:hypothetical protein [Alphaproteobacteria bacterium]